MIGELFLATALTYITYRQPLLVHNRRLQSIIIVADILLLSLLYWFTGTAESDLLFLFYYLPLLSATEYLSGIVVFYIATTTLAFLSVLGLLSSSAAMQPLELLLRVFLPREVFFMGGIFVLAFLRRLEKLQKEHMRRHQAKMQELLDFRSDIGTRFDVGHILELTLKQALSIAEATGGYITLLDPKNRKLLIEPNLPSVCLAPQCDIDRMIALLDQCAIDQRKPHSLHLADHPELHGCFIPQVHTLMCVPIMIHTAMWGTISVAAGEGQTLLDDSSLLLATLAAQAGSILERTQLLGALTDIGRATASIMELKTELESILDVLVQMGFEFATVSLVDDYQQSVLTTRGRNVPPGWIQKAQYH